MYTPMSHVRVHWERTDATRILVPWIPQGAKVKAIGPEALYEDDTKDPEWLRKQHTLRGQLLSLVHDMDEHPREGPSVEALKSVAFWPKMGADMSEHWWSCADCLPEVRALKGIGTGIMALRRCTVLQLDHFKLPGTWGEMCGVDEILTITDSATRVTSYEVVEGQSAQQTARVLYDRWIPYYGTPEALITDPHPGFASEVMNGLRKLLGIREHEKAAPREKSKTVDVESRHNNLKRILTNGFMKGDIKSPRDLQTCCRKEKMRHDFGEANDVSPFECATGQMPSPGRNMAMVPPEKAKERVSSMHMRCRTCRKEEEGDIDSRVHQRGAGIPWMLTEHRTDDEAEDRESEESRSDDEIDQSDNARKSDSSTEGNSAMLRERHGLKQEGERNEARQTKEKASSGNLISRDEEMTAAGEGVVPARRQGISIMHAQVPLLLHQLSSLRPSRSNLARRFFLLSDAPRPLCLLALTHVSLGAWRCSLLCSNHSSSRYRSDRSRRHFLIFQILDLRFRHPFDALSASKVSLRPADVPCCLCPLPLPFCMFCIPCALTLLFLLLSQVVPSPCSFLEMTSGLSRIQTVRHHLFPRRRASSLLFGNMFAGPLEISHRPS